MAMLGKGIMSSPYISLEKRAFWRTGVSERHPLDPGELYRPKFQLPKKLKVATAGSCFAQHIGRTLRAVGINVLDGERLPPWVDDGLAHRFGYRQFSARHGNIYTIRQLLQLHQEAYSEFRPSCSIWEKNGRFYDALRPSVEPNGLPSRESVVHHRQRHLTALREVYEKANLVIFTFGLTEAWVHSQSGTIYPTAPGTVVGDFDAETYSFKNFTVREILADFCEFRRRLRGGKKGVKFIVTVSPVPLTATASGHHVEVATSYSKSVLRAVCGELASRFRDVDYFPSYEIITSSNNRGVYFDQNKRTVNDLGVRAAMRMFIDAHEFSNGEANNNSDGANIGIDASIDEAENVYCEYALLEYFSK